MPLSLLDLESELAEVNAAMLTALGVELRMLEHWAILLRDRIAAQRKRSA